jgi:serine/threonine protein kinase
MSASTLFDHFCTLVDIPQNQHSDYIAQHIKNADMADELIALLDTHFSQNTHTHWHDLIANEAQSITGDAQLQHLLGTQVGVYTLKKVIGEGGMGIVFLAQRHDDLIQQQVAIKFFSPSIMQVVGGNLAQNQAQILAQLNHPNITYVYDAGITEAGLHYVVMEYVEGVPIDQYCIDNQLNFIERIQLFLTVCDAISKTHLINIAHSDIKPANVLVSKHGVVKILDFDIAKALQHNELESEKDSINRYLRALSLAYASPEQLMGKALNVATDQYSLGVLLYVLLTEKMPFNVKNQDVNTLVDDINKGCTLPLVIDSSALSITAHQKWFIQYDIKQIIAKAMSVDVAQRYDGVAAFQSDIYKALKLFPTQANRTVFQRTKKWFVRNPLAAVSYSLMLGAAATIFIQNEQIKHQRNMALAALQIVQQPVNNSLLANEALSTVKKLQLFYEISHGFFAKQQYGQAITVLETILNDPQYLKQDIKNQQRLSLLLIKCYEHTQQGTHATLFKEKLQILIKANEFN